MKPPHATASYGKGSVTWRDLQSPTWGAFQASEVCCSLWCRLGRLRWLRGRVDLRPGGFCFSLSNSWSRVALKHQKVGSSTQNKKPISTHIYPYLSSISHLSIWSIMIHVYSMDGLLSECAIRSSKWGTSSRRVSYFWSRPKRCLRQLVNLDELRSCFNFKAWIFSSDTAQGLSSSHPNSSIAKWRCLKLVLFVPVRPLVISGICVDPWDSEVFQTFTGTAHALHTNGCGKRGALPAGLAWTSIAFVFQVRVCQTCFEGMDPLVFEHMHRALKTR